MTKKPKMSKVTERRVKRADDVAKALQYQLDACRSAAHAPAMVISDEHGLCLAAAGPRETCDEVAAELPLIGRKTREFEGVLLATGGGRRITMQRFDVRGDELYVGVIEGDESRIPAQLARSISGVSRILTT